MSAFVKLLQCSRSFFKLWRASCNFVREIFHSNLSWLATCFAPSRDLALPDLDLQDDFWEFFALYSVIVFLVGCGVGFAAATWRSGRVQELHLAPATQWVAQRLPRRGTSPSPAVHQAQLQQWASPLRDRSRSSPPSPGARRQLLQEFPVGLTTTPVRAAPSAKGGLRPL